MSMLQQYKVLVVNPGTQTALERFFVGLGAEVQQCTLSELAASKDFDQLANADFLVDFVGQTALDVAGLTRQLIEARCPTLIQVSVTPFGNGGPRSNWHGSELVASAMSGTLRMCGDPDRAPVKEALDACEFHAQMVAATGALTALYERTQSGLGQHVDVSVQEVAFSRNVNGVLSWQFDRRKLHRVGGALNYGRATVRCIWPLADGFCFHTLMTGRFGAPANQALSDWMDEVGVENPLHGVDWLKYNRSTLDPALRVVWERAIELFFRTRTRKDIAIDGLQRGINATVCAEPSDVIADPHLRARGFWESPACMKSAMDSTVPPLFLSIAEGAATDVKQSTARTKISGARSGPLSGVRVLDFSWALVGSITTKCLGDLGADVIKVESRTRPCLSRLDVQVNASRPDSFDDKPWFAHLNSSKLSLALDMKQPASRDVLNPLIDWADVVVENFSPGTMQKLGLDYETLLKRKPDIVMVSGSVYGQTGPLAQSWGVDGTGAALSGRTLLTGWPDRAPVIPSAVPYGDVIVPYVMAAAVAGALAKRTVTGTGMHIDASMYEICVQQMCSAIDAVAQGDQPSRMGNSDHRAFHQGVYATQGEDRWLAITLRTETEWETLRSALSLGHASSTAERDQLLVERLRQERDHDVMHRLQAKGIAAGVVQDIEDTVDHDPQLKSRGALWDMEHAVLGRFGHMRTPITFSRSILKPFRAPSLGEHSEHIATGISALSRQRIAELKELGVFK
jgi:crotonobetainyl-CoA:carnitine CoA-transferase CaiB-like acyl-CoA transferase